MTIPLASLQFTGRILIPKTQLQAPPAESASTEADAEHPVDPEQITEDNFVQKLGAGQWAKGDLGFTRHQTAHFVQAQTINANNPQADLKAVDALTAKGIHFSFLPTQEQNTMPAADRVTTDIDYLRKRVEKGQPVAYTTNPAEATPQHILDTEA